MCHARTGRANSICVSGRAVVGDADSVLLVGLPGADNNHHGGSALAVGQDVALIQAAVALVAQRVEPVAFFIDICACSVEELPFSAGVGLDGVGGVKVSDGGRVREVAALEDLVDVCEVVGEGTLVGVSLVADSICGRSSPLNEVEPFIGVGDSNTAGPCKCASSRIGGDVIFSQQLEDADCWTASRVVCAVGECRQEDVGGKVGPEEVGHPEVWCNFSKFLD